MLVGSSCRTPYYSVLLATPYYLRRGSAVRGGEAEREESATDVAVELGPFIIRILMLVRSSTFKAKEKYEWQVPAPI